MIFARSKIRPTTGCYFALALAQTTKQCRRLEKYGGGCYGMIQEEMNVGTAVAAASQRMPELS
jgi:hypothetical protein